MRGIIPSNGLMAVIEAIPVPGKGQGSGFDQGE